MICTVLVWITVPLVSFFNVSFSYFRWFSWTLDGEKPPSRWLFSASTNFWQAGVFQKADLKCHSVSLFEWDNVWASQKFHSSESWRRCTCCSLVCIPPVVTWVISVSYHCACWQKMYTCIVSCTHKHISPISQQIYSMFQFSFKVLLHDPHLQKWDVCAVVV